MRGWEKVTPADVAKLGRKVPTKPARSKYGAVKTVVDNITFDSKREAERYEELRALERSGEIQHLILQPSYPLEVVAAGSGVRHRLGEYRADFAYSTKEADVVEDVKGFKTALYRWKKKHVEAQYGIQIREVR